VNIIWKPLLVLLGLPKTIWFNLHYLPLRQAMRLPVWVSHRVWILRGKGHVSVARNVCFGRVQIGFNNIGIFDQIRSRSIWEVSGDVVFKGPAIIGHGSKICVMPYGCLTFGEGTTINAESAVICAHRIRFGAGCMVSWQVLIMDSDLHAVVGMRDQQRINPDQPIEIGDRVWLGSRVTVLKGTRIGNGSVVSAGAICAGDLALENVIYAGVPARPIRHEVTWQK